MNKKVINISADTNVITDTALKRLINSFLGKSLDADITATELSTIDFIDARYDSAITIDKAESLAGLENAFILSGLDITGNEVGDISFLRDIDTLEFLQAEGNIITNLQNINKNLLVLGLQANSIESIAGVSKALGIDTLNLAGNEIKDISELKLLTSLNNIILTRNKIADVSILNGFQVNDSNLDKWVALGQQAVELNPIYYEKINDNIIISLPLEGKLKDLNDNVPEVINNIIYRDLNDGIVVTGDYDINSKTINYQITEIPKLVSFDFNTTTDDTLADSFNGNAIAYVAIRIENEVIKDYINEKIEEAGGVKSDPILYKDYKGKGIDTLTNIDLSNRGLINLKDIDLFPGAVEINVDNNNLVDMSNLFKLSNIRAIKVSAENQINEFEDSIILGENYVFNLKNLSVNETGSDKFEVEFQISDISHNGVYDNITNTIKWTGLNRDTVLTFNYIKVYKELNNIIQDGIGGSAAGEPYDNIINTGTTIINLTVSISRGVDLF